jgi:O-antigen ligase
MSAAQQHSCDTPCQGAPTPTTRLSPRAQRAWLWAELAVLLLIAPVLWFPSLRPVLTGLGLALWGCLILAEGLALHEFWPRSVYDLPLLLLSSMVLIGVLRSSELLLTIPKLTSFILGLALYRLILRGARQPRALLGALWALLALGLCFSAVALSSGLRPSKVPEVSSYFAYLPRLLQALPESQGGRVNLNQLGGSLLYILPLGWAVALAPWSRRAAHISAPAWRIPWPVRALALALSALLTAALLLSQSRAAWAGMLAGLLCLLACRGREGQCAVLLVLVALSLGWFFWGRAQLAPALLQALEKSLPSAVGGISLAGRVEIWRRAWECIMQQPLFGCGLGTFRLLDGVMRPSRTVFDVGTAHAHNVFLQMGFDVGLPGLLAYLLLVYQAIRQSWRALLSHAPLLQALATGCLASLLAYHVYGVFDVVALGAKTSVLFWGLLALPAALARNLAPIEEPRIDVAGPQDADA